MNSNKTMHLFIPGKPIAKTRPRFARRGKFTITYSDQQTEEGKFLLLAREQINEKFLGPLSVYLKFFIERPKNHFGTGRNKGRLKDSAPAFPTSSRSDLDNYIKFALDCLNGEAFQDDRQIVSLSAEKIYREEPGTEIFILNKEVNDGKNRAIIK